MSVDLIKEWTDDYYRGREDDLLVPHIIERLVSLGYIVERVSVKHQKGGYGSTKGIGDLLVWRNTWPLALGLPGLKMNVEVKTSHSARKQLEQSLSLAEGGLIVVTTPDEAQWQMAQVDQMISQLSGITYERIIASQGSEGFRRFLPARETQKKVRRTPKWLKEARDSASGGTSPDTTG